MNIDEIILKVWNSPDINKYCRVVGKNDWEELKSELINQLYNMDKSKLNNAYKNNFLEYLCFTICSRIKKGRVKNSGMFWKIKSITTENYPRISENEYEEQILVDNLEGCKINGEKVFNTIIKNEDIDIINLYLKLLSTVDNQHWYGKTLFSKYYIEGYKLRELSNMYKINIKSISWAIRKVKKEIKNKLKNDAIDFNWN